jgi:hypothetical protein
MLPLRRRTDQSISAFMDQDNHATQLVRLQIHENGVPVAQFNNVPIN